MGKISGYIDKARRNIQVADHMAYMTYNVVKDPKVLLVVVENLFYALENALTSVLEVESRYKRVPLYPNNFNSKVNVFEKYCINKYNIDYRFVKLIRELKDILKKHKESPVEFRRQDKFVICYDNYKMRTITIENIKKYITDSKSYIRQIGDNFEQNGRNFL